MCDTRGMLLLSYALCALAVLPTLPRMGFPRAPKARAEAEARVAAVYAAIEGVTDDPELQAELRRLCRRESFCNWYSVVGVHKGDSSLGRARWRKAVARGLLHPDECLSHQLGDTREQWVWWSTVGAFGTVSAYVVRHAGECVDPRTMVDPRMAAELVLEHMDVLCSRHKACDCPARARWWAGPGRWDVRTPLEQLGGVTRQCGAQETHEVVWAILQTPTHYAARAIWDVAAWLPGG